MGSQRTHTTGSPLPLFDGEEGSIHSNVLAYYHESVYFSKVLRMLNHSASSGSRQTGLPTRLYQYVAFS